MNKEQAQEAVLAHELVTNERIVEHPKLGKVRISRPTPKMQFLIGDEYRKQFHKDLKDPEILSRAELETAYFRRGMWSPELDDKIGTLIRQMGTFVAALEHLGYGTREEVLQEYFSIQERLLVLYKDYPELIEAINRYFSLDEDPDPEDRKAIFDAAETTDVDELLDDTDTLREQLSILIEMKSVRDELTKLQLLKTNLFKDSVEFRAERAEQLAQIYYCCRNAETDAPLWPTLQDLWDADAEVVEFLQAELYYFQNGVTEDMREMLGRHGFMERAVDIVNSSDDSQDRPKDSSDGELAENEPPISSELETSTN